MDYGRCVADQVISHRFMTVNEQFTAAENKEREALLLPNEAFVYYRFSGGPLTISQLRELSSGQEQGVLQALYVLWLSGLLKRNEWNAAFSENRLNHIRRTSIAKIREASDVAESWKPQPEAIPVSTLGQTEPAPEKLPTTELTLEQYLERSEKGDTHYDTLGIDPKGDMTSIKALYFSLAKQFHPDRHHRESPETMKRVQTAFTALAQAYEILKSTDSREAYNAKMYKEIEAREKRREAGVADADPADRNAESGLDNFEEGLSLLNDDEPEAAIVYLARAVHYSPQNALYHSYYGVALSSDPKQRHKAESELQAGVKLDSKNPKIRMMLVEFLVDNNMLKRAEGELRRFLEVVPNNKEATAMLNRIAVSGT
jgi:tetratricopeptide (TPR) repeat protein